MIHSVPTVTNTGDKTEPVNFMRDSSTLLFDRKLGSHGPMHLNVKRGRGTFLKILLELSLTQNFSQCGSLIDLLVLNALTILRP